MSHVTCAAKRNRKIHMNESCHIVGLCMCERLMHLVSVAEYCLFYRSLLQNIVSFIGLFCKRENAWVSHTFLVYACVRDWCIFTHMSHDVCMCVSVHSNKMWWCIHVTQVSFAEIRLIYRSLLQNIVSFIGLFCKECIAQDVMMHPCYLTCTPLCVMKNEYFSIFIKISL